MKTLESCHLHLSWPRDVGSSLSVKASKEKLVNHLPGKGQKTEQESNSMKFGVTSDAELQ